FYDAVARYLINVSGGAEQPVGHTPRALSISLDAILEKKSLCAPSLEEGRNAYLFTQGTQEFLRLRAQLMNTSRGDVERNRREREEIEDGTHERQQDEGVHHGEHGKQPRPL
ncbi:MAG: hypothetical protein ACO3JL_05060, partial [Myxococcota bacterium]